MLHNKIILTIMSPVFEMWTASLYNSSFLFLFSPPLSFFYYFAWSNKIRATTPRVTGLNRINKRELQQRSYSHNCYNKENKKENGSCLIAINAFASAILCPYNHWPFLLYIAYLTCSQFIAGESPTSQITRTHIDSHTKSHTIK